MDKKKKKLHYSNLGASALLLWEILPDVISVTSALLGPLHDSAGPYLQTPIHPWGTWYESLPWRVHAGHKETVPSCEIEKQKKITWILQIHVRVVMCGRHGGMGWCSHLADMLWEAVPRALLPRMHNPKQRLTRGESLSQVTGYNTI